MQWHFDISQTWEGKALPRCEHASVCLTLPRERPDIAQVALRSPFYADTAPPSLAGSTPGLWEYEVVELMLLGRDDQYLELEFGPHGHFLMLQLRGERNVTSSGAPFDYVASIDGETWTASAEFPRDWIPAGFDRANAYAIHGEAANRQYYAWQAPGGAAPDFHKLAAFGAIEGARLSKPGA